MHLTVITSLTACIFNWNQPPQRAILGFEGGESHHAKNFNKISNFQSQVVVNSTEIVVSQTGQQEIVK